MVVIADAGYYLPEKEPGRGKRVEKGSLMEKPGRGTKNYGRIQAK